MPQHAFRFGTLLLAGLVAVFQAAAIDWADLGSDWSTGANWVGGVAPGSGDTASLPADAAIANQPDVATDQAVGALVIDTSAGTYSVSGGGTLSLGNGGLSATGGGSAALGNFQTGLDADQVWTIGSGTTLTLTGRFRQGDAGGNSKTFTKDGDGTLTLAGAAYPSGVSPSRPLMQADAGTMNVQWNGLANGVRPTLRAAGTSTINVNAPVNASFHYHQAADNGELIFHTNTSPERLYTGQPTDGGTLTVANGVVVDNGFGNPSTVMQGGTIRTLGSGTVEVLKVQVNASAQTATIQGNLVGTNNGDPTSQGGGGMWFYHANAAAGAAAIHLDLQADISGTQGIAIAHGFNLFTAATFRISGNNSYSGATRFGGGTLLLGGNAPVSANGILGNAASPLYIGFEQRSAAVRVLTDGPYTIARDIEIVEEEGLQSGVGNDTVTLGGNTADLSSFTGDIALGPVVGMNQPDLFLTAAAGGAVTFAGGIMDGAAKGVIKQGPGTVIISGSPTYSGDTAVQAGTLRVDGVISSNVSASSGATVAGSGSIAGTVDIVSGATLSPGASIGALQTGSLSLQPGSTTVIEVSGTAADQIAVTGSVSIAGSLTMVALTAATGSSYVIISNDDTDAVTGAFNTLPEGATVNIGGDSFVISYVGGDGNDVVLTPGTGGSGPGPSGPFDWYDTGADWGTGSHWFGGTVPGPGDVANLIADTSILNQPNVATDQTVSGVTVETDYDAYETTGSANLIVGSDGIVATGGGTSRLGNSQIALSVDQTWSVAADTELEIAAKYHQADLANASKVLTKTGPGTLTFTGPADNAGVSPSRPNFFTNEGTTNIQWNGLANGVRYTIRATDTGVINLNSPSNTSFHYHHASDNGEVVYHTDTSPERIYTGQDGDGGTITVADGVAINNGFGNPSTIMNGGTIRTLGSGTVKVLKVQVNPSSQTATIQGNLAGTNNGDPTSQGGGGMWFYHANAPAGPAALHLDLQADIGGTQGIAIAHGFNLFTAATFRISGNSSYSGVTRFGGGTLLLGGNAPVSANGILGNAASPLYIGFEQRSAAVRVLTDGPYTIARDIEIVEEEGLQGGVGNDTVTLGGNTADLSSFTGDVALGPVDGMNQPNLFLTAAAGGTVTFAGSIMNGAAKGVIKQGAGTVILSGSSTYTGATALNVGTLLVHGAITSATTAASGTTLGGNGSISGTVTVAGGATLAAGASVGTLATGDLVISSGATTEVEIDGASADKIIVSGSVSVAGALNFSELSPATASGYILIDNDGVDPVSGTFDSWPEGTPVSFSGNDYIFTYLGGDGNDVALAPACDCTALTDVFPEQLCLEFESNPPTSSEDALDRAEALAASLLVTVGLAGCDDCVAAALLLLAP